MELEKLLQRFKKIQPDKDYAASSRRVILATTRPAQKSFGIVQFIFSNVQSASAIALTSLFLVLIFGGFSVFKVLNPFRLSSLDPVGLKAEADAVDMQLQVAGVTYDATENTVGGTSTVIVTVPAKHQVIIKPGESISIQPESTSTSIISTSTPSTSTPPVSIDSALDILSN